MVKISLIATVGTILLASSMVSAGFLSSALDMNRAQLELESLQQGITFDEAHTKYYMACGRGALDGFIGGFYANDTETISKDCLGESTYKHLNSFFTMLNSGNILEIFKSFGVFYQFSFEVQKSCRSNEISFEVMSFCLNKTNNCTINSITENFQKSLFKLTGAANKIAEVLVNTYQNFGKEDLAKLDDAAATYKELGKSMGQVFRTILGFTKNIGEGRKPRTPVTPVTPTTL